MKAKDIIDELNLKFPDIDSTIFHEESGLRLDYDKEVMRVGYATNLTEEVAELAVEKKMDLIVTHYGMRYFNDDFNDRCKKLLHDNQIAHYYNHLPLDDADFGTNASLAEALNLSVTKKVNEDDGFMCGVIAESKEPIPFHIFVDTIEKVLGEPVQSWRFNDKPIKKVHIVTGGGQRLNDLAVSIEEGADVYLTGEKMVYTVEYAKYKKINLIVASHSYTEIFGVRSMAELILGIDNNLELVWLEESHFEAQGIRR